MLMYANSGQNKLNPFSTNVPFLYSLKTSDILWFSDVFKGYRSGILVEKGLMSKKREKLTSIYIRENNPVSRQYKCMYSNKKTVFVKNVMHLLKSILIVTARKSFEFVSWFTKKTYIMVSSFSEYS